MSTPIEFPSPRGGHLTTWLVKAGAKVSKGQKVGYGVIQDETRKQPIFAPCYGKISELKLADGDTVAAIGSNMTTEKPVLGYVDECKHTRLFEGLCTVCGANTRQEQTAGSNKRPREDDSSGNEPLYTFNARSGYQLSIAPTEAEKIDAAIHKRLLSKRQLSLVLDLDHTLVHATCDQKAESLLHQVSLYTFYIAGHKYYIKRRPNLDSFLWAAAQHFELQVDTAASRDYAECVVAHIDPTRKLFGDPPRIVSRSDSDRNMRHKQVAWLHNALLDDSMVLVIDDTETVWKGADNLMIIEPYHFVGFRRLAEVNNASGVSMTSNQSQQHARHNSESSLEETFMERDKDDYLLHLLKVLFLVHQEFYRSVGVSIPDEQYDINSLSRLRYINTKSAEVTEVGKPAKTILQEYISNILRGYRIVFSGVFPINTVPHDTPLWRRTCKFGATVTNSIDDTVTHVVACRPGTEKVVEASKKESIRIVHLSWLQETLRRYALQNESGHPVPDFEKHTTKPIRTEMELISEDLALSDGDDSEDSSSSEY